MGEKIKLGDFGYFVFRFYRHMVMKANGEIVKKKFDDTYYMDGMEVIDVDKKTILLKGMGGEKIIVDRKDIKSFEPGQKPTFRINKK